MTAKLTPGTHRNITSPWLRRILASRLSTLRWNFFLVHRFRGEWGLRKYGPKYSTIKEDFSAVQAAIDAAKEQG